uniref:Mitochondrial ribosomal protein L1 n=1 Tax=Buteo japonicus TaxID=224669 RepID=A0A8C0BGN2_9AVES
SLTWFHATQMWLCCLRSLIAHRAFGFSITAKKGSRKTKQEETKKKKVTRRWPLMSKPVDDVYLTWYYERPSYDVEEALGMLKKFQELDFTNPKQYVYINVFLDMALQKKKKVDPFASIVLLPYRFTDEVNKVLVFTEVAEIARENGAAVVGGVELIKWILEDEIQVDFYVAVPAIMPKLIPLRSKLKRKYPNSMGHDIPKMLKLFREGLEYMVEGERLIKTRIARVIVHVNFNGLLIYMILKTEVLGTLLLKCVLSCTLIQAGSIFGSS